jgi:hypothetical protein
MDPFGWSPSCMQVEYAAPATHNYQTYLNTWGTLTNEAASGMDNLQTRPKGYAILNDNTTVTAPWIEQEFSNMTKLYETHGHIIVNVSMAMPHTGVMDSARDPVNGIIQPEDLDGQGNYRVRASVPSPVIHVTCAMLSKEDLRPVILSLPNSTMPEDTTALTSNTSSVHRGGSSIDDIFGWGTSYGDYNWPPIFPKLPLGHNTIVNDTAHMLYGRDSIYLLGNSTKEFDAAAIPSGTPSDNFIYPLCQLKVSLTSHCSTVYDASSGRATLIAHCEDDTDKMAYVRSRPNATIGRGYTSREWPWIGGALLKSMCRNSWLGSSANHVLN